ncbi:MAG: GrpB family protein [Planctomycetota bacterium]|nr:MAG: GrpB family protein [Planctomycetota bacterium]REJ97088.1 MAG: GrpB family protein [Planctomycetota bacterium]REK20581.1 MAG: GrpB family protein [Planctomycetota bacterium]
MPSVYSFVDYSPEWPALFEQAAERLRSLIGDDLIEIHHIGSTSVPGLAAKPIIDIVPIVRDITRDTVFSPILEEAGYKVWGEYGIPGRRYFTRDRGNVRTHNIHLFEQGDPQIERHVAFCAYLREHPEVRDEYAALKREVYQRHPADIAAYSDGKDAWIKRVEPVAVHWFRAYVSDM